MSRDEQGGPADNGSASRAARSRPSVVRRSDIPEPAELAHCPFCGSLPWSVSAHTKATVWEFKYVDQYGHCWLTKAVQP